MVVTGKREYRANEWTCSSIVDAAEVSGSW
jgi:hypothetical protein